MSRARTIADYAARNADNKAGLIAFFSASTAPDGWLACDGAVVSRTTYAALFAAIGTTYGVGDGTTTFSLPDLRGEFLRGLDGGRGVDSGRAIGSAQGHRANSITEFGRDDTSPISSVVTVPEDGAFTSRIFSGTNAAGTSLGMKVRKSGGETRPRNVAMLPCIKT
jgi:phage-related tail fiber protein